MRPDGLLRLAVRGEPDVFLLRQRGREVAAAVGLDRQDQIRVATALSDLGREVLGRDTPATVEFHVMLDPRPALRIQLTWRGGDAVPESDVGWVSATRLMNDVQADSHGDRRVISLFKHLPPAASVSRDHLASLRARLAKLTRGSALDELRAQNAELLVTLDSLELKQAELMRLNAELEETNRGVMALYSELSDELEETNRGVVALYAELDDKSTQLKEASEAKTRFWANISHELRTPINSIVGLARLLLHSTADPLTEEQRHQIEMIGSSGRTLLALVNELLDAAKAESGRLRPQLAVVNLAQLLAQLRGTLRPTVPMGDVALVIDEPPPSVEIVTDETMLMRILRNLVSNGLKFTEQGVVRLSVCRDDTAGQWVFVVSDTGIGIPPEQQRRVFEEFHQVPNPLQARTSGTGLGLPYARRLAEILDGSLELTSTVGVGTEVTLRLPAEDPDAGGRPLGSVLLVDDDEAFRLTFRKLIAERAVTVREAQDAGEAVRAATADPPDLIFLDLNIPAADGYDCIAALRREPTLINVPVVVVTSVDAAGIDYAALGHGVSVLDKAELSVTVVQDGVRRARQAVGGQEGNDQNRPGG